MECRTPGLWSNTNTVLKIQIGWFVILLKGLYHTNCMLYYFFKKWFTVFPWVSIHFKIVVMITWMFYVKNGNWPWWIMRRRGMYCFPMKVCVICYIFPIKIVLKQQTFLKKNCCLVVFISDETPKDPSSWHKADKLYISMITVIYYATIFPWLVNPIDPVLYKCDVSEVHFCEAGW